MRTSSLDQLDTPGPEEMKQLIASLSPEERAILKDPDFITEDEADIIMSGRSLAEGGPFISVDDLRREFNLPRRKKTA